jgi:proteasome assembly chaperone 3
MKIALEQSAMESVQLVDEPFPATAKQATGHIDGLPTEASSLFFADRILVTLCQDGRLSQWVSLRRE